MLNDKILWELTSPKILIKRWNCCLKQTVRDSLALEMWVLQPAQRRLNHCSTVPICNLGAETLRAMQPTSTLQS